MIWKFLKQNVLFPKGLNWVQHWVSRIGLFARKSEKSIAQECEKSNSGWRASNKRVFAQVPSSGGCAVHKSIAFLGWIHWWSNLLQYDKMRHRKVPLSSCHLNGHTIGFVRKVLLSSFHLNGHTLGFRAQTRKLEPNLLSNLLIPSTDPNLIAAISFQHFHCSTRRLESLLNKKKLKNESELRMTSLKFSYLNHILNR